MKGRPPIYRRGQTWYATETRRSLGTKDRAEALKLVRASRRAAEETATPPIGDAGGSGDPPRIPASGLRAPEVASAATPPAAVDSLSPAAGAPPPKPEGDPLSEVGAEPAAPAAPPLAPEVQEIADQLGLKDVMTPEEVKEVTALVSPAVVGLVVKLTGIAAGWMRSTPKPPPSDRSLALLSKMVDIKVGRALANAQLSENVVLGVAVVVVFAEQAFGDPPAPPPAAVPSLH